MPKPRKVNCQLPGAEEVAQGKSVQEALRPHAGRPTEYLPGFCDSVIEMGRKGYSKAMIAAELNVVRNTLDNWAERHPEFLNAINVAREFSLAWWEAQGLMGIWSRDFNANAYRLQVTNRFPDEWKEKTTQELTGADGGPVEHKHKHELTDEALAAIAAKHG